MASYLPPLPVLISETPRVERRGEHFFISDTVDGVVVFVRAYPASVFFEMFRLEAQQCQEWRVDQSAKVARIDQWREAAG